VNQDIASFVERSEPREGRKREEKRLEEKRRGKGKKHATRRKRDWVFPIHLSFWRSRKRGKKREQGKEKKKRKERDRFLAPSAKYGLSYFSFPSLDRVDQAEKKREGKKK